MVKMSEGWGKGNRRFTETEFNNSYIKKNTRGYTYEKYITETKIVNGELKLKFPRQKRELQDNVGFGLNFHK